MENISPVCADAAGIRIDGTYTTLLCASLFYFRIPEGLWQDRMRKIKASGYNSIDVYFPWNFHETRRDHWEMQGGMRDVSFFLDLAAREGLYVVARPGPYICSEWDGGSLPAYLAAEGIAIRQNDAAYLARVREWYGRILPVIAAHELGRGGSVVLVQIENELDFFDCRDVKGYIAALRDMTRGMGIKVPLVACAGQGDLEGAWAAVPGVLPATNLYLDPRTPNMEAGLAPYVESEASLGLPLLVTETGRDVLLLRRLLAAGAKLLGPYNQVGGYDFGFTTSVNNWGSPLSFQTSHYDFSSLVSTFGELRESVPEHKALGCLLSALGPTLAAARVTADHGVVARTVGGAQSDWLPGLKLSQEGNGGYAVSVTNTADVPMEATLERGGERWPKSAPMHVDAGSSAFAFFDLSLSPWKIPAVIRFSSAEPFSVRGGKDAVLVFQALGPAEIHLAFGAQRHVFQFDGCGVHKEVYEVPGGGSLSVSCFPRREAMDVVLDARGEVTQKAAAAPKPGRKLEVQWRMSVVAHEELFPDQVPAARAASLCMELHGGARGYALYRASLPAGESDTFAGILFHDAADILSVYVDGTYLGTQVPGGAHAFFPFPPGLLRPGHEARVLARAEIWGHSNFDDARMPAIRLHSLRGFSRATLVKRIESLALWSIQPEGRGEFSTPYLGMAGSRLTCAVPARASCACALAPDPSCDSFFLRAEAPECPSLVHADGAPRGWVDRYHPILELGSARSLMLWPQKWYASESAGKMSLMAGVGLKEWSISCIQEPALLASAERCLSRAEETRFPLHLSPGSLAWLHGTPRENGRFPCHSLVVRGRGIKASVLFNGTLVGRLFLDAPIRPKMAGGRDDLAYLPGCWFREAGNEISVLLESIDGEPGVLERIELDPR